MVSERGIHSVSISVAVGNDQIHMRSIRIEARSEENNDCDNQNKHSNNCNHYFLIQASQNLLSRQVVLVIKECKCRNINSYEPILASER